MLCDSKVSVISATEGVVSANKSYVELAVGQQPVHLREAHRFLMMIRCASGIGY